MFLQNGFDSEEVGICDKLVENRSLELVMKRRWIQAVFSIRSDSLNSAEKLCQEAISQRLNKSASENSANNAEIDLSESILGMFDSFPSIDEVVEIKVRGYNFSIKALSKEYQHTCKSTGLMLWESARLMCNLLAENPSIVEGKSVLELGCGSAGICSMISVPFAELVVSTDGDTEALTLLHENVASNIDPGLIQKMVIKKLTWGKKEDIMAVKEHGSFDLIIGTDVTYYTEAISPLFETASDLTAKNNGEMRSSLILCHVQRRVHEESIVSAAAGYGFKLVDRWMNGTNSNDGIISTWFSSGPWRSAFENTPLSILYFEI